MSGLLILSAFGNVIAAIATAMTLISSLAERPIEHTLDGAITLAGLVASLYALWGIWKWRRWGVYLYFSLSVAFLLLSAIAGLVSFRTAIAVALLTGLAVAVGKQWAQFR